MSRDRGTVETLASGTRIGQFVSVGVVGATVDIASSTALSELGVFPELAALIGIETAIVVMFLLNDRVTFAGEGAAGVVPALRRLVRSNVVRAGGTAVQLVVFTLLFRVVAIPVSAAGIDLWFVASRVGGIGAGMVVNYVAESLFTWRVGE
ncbi:GtrA family protein [Halobaculum sp. CBA1158]|uniref:GtrA family protein n=1 Tax=Halobaculum sp. CBA1158 TaxID=2904243 RepID=UPI001F337F98|nr:GtrA family protein [Halobaculum sp. CBA1158]UIP00207.1 GtrA family protein [Halobaculum sp. CBA1158]